MNWIFIQPIYALEREWGEAPFDLSLLPLEVCNGVSIEEVGHLFTDKTFSWVGDGLTKKDHETLSSVQYALVRREEVDNDLIILNRATALKVEPVEVIMACLRIIRPMRERLGIMRGEILEDGSLNINKFGVPYDVINVPDVEKLFEFRTQDAKLLQILAPKMMIATQGDYWKIRMAIEFYQMGHFLDRHWKSRVFSRCSAIEALFSSKRQQGSQIVKNRIIKFLGQHTCIYEPGDIPSYLPQASEITVGSILDHVYLVRNCLAHGDKLPDHLFKTILRQGVNDPLNAVAVVDEAVSFIVRASIRRILGRVHTI